MRDPTEEAGIIKNLEVWDCDPGELRLTLLLGDTGQVVLCLYSGRCLWFGSRLVSTGWFSCLWRRDKEADSASVKSRDWKFAGLPLTGTDIKKGRKNLTSSSSFSFLDSLWQTWGQSLTGSHLAKGQHYLDLRECSLMTESPLPMQFYFEDNYSVLLLNIQRWR